VEPLVEVHNRKELDLALETDTRVIGINNRDFEPLKSTSEPQKSWPLLSGNVTLITEPGI